jgi:hypothetical protein
MEKRSIAKARARVKLTFLWQWKAFPDREWITRLLEPFAGEQVYDCQHRIVLDNCLVIDAYLHAKPAEYFNQFRGKNAWLLHLRDETYEGGYRNYDNFRGVFRTHWSAIFNPARVLHVPLGYPNGFTGGTGEWGTARRPYLWSFLGAVNRSSRPEMIKALLPLKPHFLHITDRGQVAPLGKTEYEQILRESVFVPSGMGNVNLECYRMYEALECGAIPIVEKRIGLDYFTNLFGAHPLPAFRNWPQAARFMEDIGRDRQALDDLQMKCFVWWRDYKENFRRRIAAMLTSPPIEEVGRPSIRSLYSVPGWHVMELMRHHTFPALLRRLKTQSLRLIHEGKLRKTTGA